MAVREVLRMGDPRLLEEAAPIADLDSEGLHGLVRDLWDTMAAYGGVGLAATQIGVPRRVVVFAVADSPRYPDAEAVPATALVNPALHPMPGDKEEAWEGCLSIPGMRGLVPRYAQLRYTGFTPEGDPVDREVSGFHARVVQHECDHLDGILYPRRIRDLRNFGFEAELVGHPSHVPE
ncbi:peptide deformylase [Thiohalorhabdus methylotrophus]|uniref:Peptide deformylase n=1 Tax=Thiohalorhabdus methylotrophus TaxID=3242694 RepID=A0ABV4TXP5_9GAMM